MRYEFLVKQSAFKNIKIKVLLFFKTQAPRSSCLRSAIEAVGYRGIAGWKVYILMVKMKLKKLIYSTKQYLLIKNLY